MPKLITTPNLTDHDEIYQRLGRLLDGLDEERSIEALARLSLLLINHVGDTEIANEAIDLARPRPLTG